MDWERAIQTNRDALIRIVAALMGLANLVIDISSNQMSRKSHGRIRRTLYAAEAAVRRLIIMAANWKAGPIVWRAVDDKAADGKPRTRSAKSASKPKIARPGAFPLADPPKHYDDEEEEDDEDGEHGGEEPYHARNYSTSRSDRLADPLAVAMLPAKHLLKRLAIIQNALDNMPREVDRYLRWLAKPTETRRPKLRPAIRMGRPPGLPHKFTHDVHHVLLEVHLLATSPPLRPLPQAADTS